MNRLFSYCIAFTILVISISVLTLNFNSKHFSDERLSVEHYVAGY